MRVKKIVAAALFVVLMLPACGMQPENEVPAFLTQPFMFTADYSVDQMEGSLSFAKTGVESCELKFLAPDTIAGMTLSMQSGTVTSTFCGITAETEASALARGNPVKTIFNLFSEASNGAVKISGDQKNGEITYEYGDGSTIMVYGGIPKQIDIPTAGMRLKITGFEKQSDPAQ